MRSAGSSAPRWGRCPASERAGGGASPPGADPQHRQLRARRDVAGKQLGTLYHAGILYGACLALGFALIQCGPRAYELAGFGMVESTLLVIAMVNIHHFIVDAFIWRIRTDPNYETVITERTA